MLQALREAKPERAPPGAPSAFPTFNVDRASTRAPASRTSAPTSSAAAWAATTHGDGISGDRHPHGQLRHDVRRGPRGGGAAARPQARSSCRIPEAPGRTAAAWPSSAGTRCMAPTASRSRAGTSTRRWTRRAPGASTAAPAAGPRRSSTTPGAPTNARAARPRRQHREGPGRYRSRSAAPAAAAWGPPEEARPRGARLGPQERLRDRVRRRRGSTAFCRTSDGHDDVERRARRAMRRAARALPETGGEW